MLTATSMLTRSASLIHWDLLAPLRIIFPADRGHRILKRQGMEISLGRSRRVAAVLNANGFHLRDRADRLDQRAIGKRTSRGQRPGIATARVVIQSRLKKHIRRRLEAAQARLRDLRRQRLCLRRQIRCMLCFCYWCQGTSCRIRSQMGMKCRKLRQGNHLVVVKNKGEYE